MTEPTATIRFVVSGRPGAATLTNESPIELSRAVMRRVRELRSKGAYVILVEIVSDGMTRRYYPDGKRRAPRDR